MFNVHIGVKAIRWSVRHQKASSSFCWYRLSLLYFPDGYTVSDVVMYWREEPVVGVDKAELPQFTIVGWETNERKIKLATGKFLQYQVSQKMKYLRNKKSQKVKCLGESNVSIFS